MYSFGSGVLFGANNAAGSTPSRFGGLQEVSVDFNFNIKELFGQYQFPIAVARGTGKISCKAKQAVIDGKVMNEIFFGQTMSAGRTAVSVEEAGTIPTTPFEITVANSAGFVADLGVTFGATGAALTKVADTPAAGQYSVTSGVYTFSTDNVAAAVKINYSYIVPVVLTATDESHVVGTTPYEVSATHAGTFKANVGVTIDGSPGYKVSGGTPSAGQYLVDEATGVYTFAAGDTGNTVLLTYTYTSAAATGSTLTINNQILGTTPTFKAVFTSVYDSKRVTFTFNKCTSSKLTFATKLEDFVIPEFDFSVFADDSGNIGTLSFDE